MNGSDGFRMPRRQFLTLTAGAGIGAATGSASAESEADTLAPPTVDPWEPREMEVRLGEMAKYPFTASSPDGGEVFLQIDWGGGNLSDWSAAVRSEQTVRTSHRYLRSGDFNVTARAKNQAGTESEWVPMGTVRVPTPPGVPDGLAGLWDFHDPENPAAARIGHDLEWAGDPPQFIATLADDGEDPQVMRGVMLTTAGTPNHWIARHHTGPNGGGSKTNQYTLVADVMIPEEPAWHALLQTDPENQRDAAWFIRGGGGDPGTVGRSRVGYSSMALARRRWQRIIISVDLTRRGAVRVYINGAPAGSFRHPDVDSEFALEPARLWWFADDNNENTALHAAMCAVFSRALDADEAAAIGYPGMSIIRPLDVRPPDVTMVSPPTEAGTTGVESVIACTAADPADHDSQIEVDWGDGTTSGWTSFGDAGRPRRIPHTWHMPGEFTISARARNIHGIASDWQPLLELRVDGDPKLTYLTNPWLQNMAPDRMVVMAETAEPAGLILQYGSAPEALGMTVDCESTPTGGGGFFHRALVTGLSAASVVHFRFASRCGRPASDPGSFRTAPGDDRDFSFAAIGDIQTNNRVRKINRWAWSADPWDPAKAMLRDMHDRGLDFVLGLGDHAQDGNAYLPTRLSHLDRMCAILGDRLPFYLAWGNHDGNSPQHPLRLAADMPSRFREDDLSTHTPGFGSYAFRHAGVFFLCLEHFSCFGGAHGFIRDTSRNDITNGWLDAELSSEQARTAAFRIVAIHVPPFCERWIDGNAELREHLVPKLEQYGVDLCMSGHMHGYQRGELNGTHYLISGCGSYLDIGEPLVAEWPHFTVGGHRDLPGSYAMESTPGVLGEPEPIEGGLFHGYTEVLVRADRMILKQHGFNADGSPIGVLDEFEIHRRG